MLSELQAGRLQREEANGYINPHKNSHSFAALGTIYKLVKAQVNPGGNTVVLPIGPCCERYNLPYSQVARSGSETVFLVSKILEVPFF